VDADSAVSSSDDRGETRVPAGPAPGAQAAFSDGGGYAISQSTLFLIG
jgi:hypothetical protein